GPRLRPEGPRGRWRVSESWPEYDFIPPRPQPRPATARRPSFDGEVVILAEAGGPLTLAGVLGRLEPDAHALGSVRDRQGEPAVLVDEIELDVVDGVAGGVVVAREARDGRLHRGAPVVDVLETQSVGARLVVVEAE